MPRKSITTEEFIKRSENIHGTRYDYSCSFYNTKEKYIKIICKEHGEFFQRPTDHWKGINGCKKCHSIKIAFQNTRRKGTLNKKISKEKLIQQFQKIHKDRYDYSLIEYIDFKTKIKIICKIHGKFEQSPTKHKQGNGCPKCKNLGSKNAKNGYRNKKTLEQFIIDAKKIHGDKYDYFLVKYVNAITKIQILCNNCKNFFITTPNRHLQKNGCPQCGGSYPLNNQTFIEKARKIHNEKYDYSLTEYKNNKIKIEIACKKCKKSFKQTPNDHLGGHNCPYCATGSISKMEVKWLDYLKIESTKRHKTIIINNKKYYVDAYDIDTNTIYEFLGDFWHGNPKKFNYNDINPINKKPYKFLYNKTIDRINLFKNNGYKVVYIWENEFSKTIKENLK